MNHYVPDFEMDEDYSIPTSSVLARTKKPAMPDEDIMELLWQNGQVVLQSQNQRSIRKSHLGETVIPAESSFAREISTNEEPTPQLFMQEDEMASWLQYSLDDSSFDRDFYADLLYPAPCAPVNAALSRTDARPIEVRPPPPLTPPSSAACRPPVPPARRTDLEGSNRLQNFMHFSRPKGRIDSGLSSSCKDAKESTVVDSSETPAVGPESRVSHVVYSTAQVSGEKIECGMMSKSGTLAVGTSSAARELATTCELTVSSSPGGSGASASANAEPQQKPPAAAVDDRKRKGREADDIECHSEDAEFESPNAKKQVRGSTSTKRSRAAEVHNLSERRRRDRINEKMRALQELIPHCNKSDKASMLDEAIEYLKSLQLQVQMMSMGCSMVPMMFPGIQQYMPPMGMGMQMGLDRPMVSFPSVIPGSSLPSPGAAAHTGSRFPMPRFHMPPVPDPSRVQATNQSDPMLSSLLLLNPDQPRIPSLADQYHQFLGFRQTQAPLTQNQAMPATNNQPSSSRGAENHQSDAPPRALQRLQSLTSPLERN